MNAVDLKLFTSLIRHMRSDRMNRQLIGFSLERMIAPVNRKDVMAFAAATQDNNSSYFDENGLAPPFFISKLIYPLVRELITRKQLRLNLLRMVHAGQTVVWHQPIRVGDALKIRLTVDNISDTPVGEMIEIGVKAFNGRQLSVEGTTGFIVRSRAAAPKKKSGRQKNLKEAFRIDIQTDKRQPLQFADASGDRNFIHTSPFLAKMAGLPGIIMHGVCVMAMCCAALTEISLQGDLKRLASMSGRFGKPVVPGDKLTLVAYDGVKPDEIPFEVFNSSGKSVFKNGMYRYNKPETCSTESLLKCS